MTVPGHLGTETVERLLARDPADLERVLPIDDRQRQLTERYIAPVLPQLEQEFLAIRETVDERIRRRLAEAKASGRIPPGGPDPEVYPKGFCLPITVQAAAEFEARGAADPSPAYQAVTAFRREGGHVTKVWGILRDMYFQNALQLGSMYFDVANDTVDATKPKVEHMPFAESGFRNIESYAGFADVAERYWQCTIVPNLHFPRLAPLLPMLLVSDDGRLTLHSAIYYMQRLNADSSFHAAEQFITDSPWADKRLPDEWLDRIARYKAEHLSPAVRTPRDGVAPTEVVRLCAEYRASAVYTSRPFLTRVMHSATAISIAADPDTSAPAGGRPE